MTLHDSNIAPDAYFARHPVPLALEYEAARKARAARLSAKVREIAEREKLRLLPPPKPIALPRAESPRPPDTLSDLARIRAAVAKFYDLNASDLASDSRKLRMIFPRQVAMYLSREMTGAGFERIARAYNKHHATIIHAYFKFVRLVESDPKVAFEVAVLKSRISLRKGHIND